MPPVVPPVSPVDDESLPDELDMPSEVVVDVVLSEVEDELELELASEVASELDMEVVADEDIPEVDVVGPPFELDIESDPADDALIDPLVDAAVVEPSGSSPPQANRVRPTSAAMTTGADPWT